METHDTNAAEETGILASQTDGVPADAPCCAWCAGIVMDCTIEPEAPAKLLKRGRGCPISIVAYSACREHMKGRNVVISAREGNGAPNMTVNGEAANPLEHYGGDACGCPTEEPGTDSSCPTTPNGGY
jgi:hypothetical protein